MAESPMSADGRGAAARALSHVRICDFSGQLAGAGATRYLAAMGAEVIRVEDPVRRGRWDILRGMAPFVDKRRGIEFGGAFNNHNVEKLGITVNMRTERGRELLRALIAQCDVVTENFSAGVMTRFGLSYEDLRAIRPDIIYVSNCGFGQTGPYKEFKTWGPIVQACCGLTAGSGVAGQPLAGWGYSYMDHHGGNFMAIAVLAALLHRSRTGEGQWIDMSCTEAGATLNGPEVLDYTVNGRPLRREGRPDSNHSQHPAMAPHNIYAAAGDDQWVAIACRNDADWAALVAVIDQPFDEPIVSNERFATRESRLANEEALDALLSAWTATRGRHETAARLQAAGVPAAIVATPEDRVEHDAGTAEWGLWPVAHHLEMGDVRVDGIPIHLSETDWRITSGAPLLGQHNHDVFTRLLGLSDADIDALATEGVI